MFARSTPVEPDRGTEPNRLQADLSESECNAHGFYPPPSLWAQPAPEPQAGEDALRSDGL
ncbi:MAG: hypothetical protein JSW68_13865 [Burkholderiales bacterium]|nr:MAG: hypothetical protein JSW68_13865 [Burkholderiales bacterium]